MRTRKKRIHANPNNTDPAYWNTVLKRAGLGIDAGRLPKGRGPVGKKCLIHCGGKAKWTHRQNNRAAKRSAAV